MLSNQTQRGQIVVIFALSFVALMLVVGLVVDGGYGWAKRREAQNAADFAAMAGARIVQLNQSSHSFNNSDVADAIVQTALANGGATIPGFAGGAHDPHYTDGSGNALGAIGPVGDTSGIPTDAAGVQVPRATISWHPFVAGLIGMDNWTADANAIARFTPGQTAPPCSLCVLGGFSSSSSGKIETEGSILIGGSGGSSSSADVTSQTGDIVVAAGSGSSSSARVTAEEGSIWIDGNFTGTSSNKLSAPNGNIYISGSVTLSSSGDITAGGSIVIGGDLTMSSSSRVTAASSVSIGGDIDAKSSSRITGNAVSYVGSYSCQSSCHVSPAATQVGSVSVPPAPAVEDPYATTLDDADADKVRESYPTYPSLTPTTVTIAASSTGTITPTATQLMRATVSSSSTATLNPGVYQYLRCQSSARCTLNPGTYYFDGNASALDLASSSDFKSNGPVTLVFLNDSGLKMTSSTRVSLEAPDGTGAPSSDFPWPGVAIYFARGNDATLQLSSSSGNSITGIVYAPDATLEMSSSTSQSVTSTVVVGKFKGSSSAKLSVASYSDGASTAPGPIHLVK